MTAIYRGYPQMVPDITSGLISSTFLSANQAVAQVQSGAIRVIGAISDGRSKYFPDAPTLAEQGFAEGPGDAVVRCRGAEGDAAAGRGADQQGAGGGVGHVRRQARARRGGLRGQERAAAGIRGYHQGRRRGVGARWSRRPASPPTEGDAGDFGRVNLFHSGIHRLLAIQSGPGLRRRPMARCAVSPLFGMFPTARNTSYIAPDRSPARPT